jgi:hypothetical protein
VFIPLIVKPVFIRYKKVEDEMFELYLVGKYYKPPITVCQQQFIRIFPYAKRINSGVEKMDRAYAEELWETQV